MKSKYSTLFVLGTLFLCAKIFYKYANISQLLWLVKPVAIWISSFTNTSMYWDDSAGYVFPSLSICIEKSCSGFNFLLICSAMLSYLILQKNNRISPKYAISILLISYLSTIVSNTTRICFSILLSQAFPQNWIVHHSFVHQGVGVLTNLFFLIFTYLVFQYLFKTSLQHEKSS